MNKVLPKKYGIMFHHFHSIKHPKSAGSISKRDFKKIIKNINIKNITSADKYLKKIEKICITFDDSLKCQYDIAFPILKKLNIKAFWFIYTSSLKPDKNNIEVFRRFRYKKFKKFDDFYKKFLSYLDFKKNLMFFLKKNKKKIIKFKKNYSFYSFNEIKFRFIRDQFLTQKEYGFIINKMYKDNNFNFKKELKELFLNKKEIKKLSDDGQIIGLHSHNHPTKISLLNKNTQQKEYVSNKNILEKIIKKKITTSSHPSGDYSIQTLKILKKIGIILSFRSNIKIDKKFIGTKYQNLTIPREDHINLLR